MRTLDNVIESLPVDQQARIKVRTEELVAELEGSEPKDSAAGAPEQEH